MGVRPWLLVAAMSGVIILAAPVLDSCSFENPPVLELDNRPDAPLSQYAAGRLGIVEPTYARSYLVVAYRYLTGLPLTPIEQQGVLTLMRARIGEPHSSEKSAPEQWLEARKAAVPGAAAIENLSPYAQHANYSSYLNCTDDAFHTAIGTLHDRVTKFGAGGAAVKSWLEAQDTVFADCDSESIIPPAADASLPKLIRQDRAYQIAAANFYVQDFDSAHDDFAEIASDSDSPWSSVGAIVAVRSLLRAATLPAESGGDLAFTYLKEPMARAEAEARAILANPRQPSIHGAARGLLQYIRIRTEPEKVMEETAERLTRGSSPSTFGNDLADYTILLDRGTTSTNALTEWLGNMQAGNLERSNDAGEPAVKKKVSEAYDTALGHWRSRHELPWLVAVLTHATGDEPSVQEVLEAARAVPVTSPAYVTLAYQRMLLVRDDALLRRELDALLALPDDRLPPGPRNDFRAMRLPYSASLDEFLRDAPRQIAGYYDQSTPETDKKEWLFDRDGASAINRSLPLDLLVKAAGDPRVPPPLDRMLLVAAFTRALLFGRDEIALKLAPRLVSAYPEIGKDMEHFVKASPAERKWEWIQLLVHYPGLDPYVRPLENRGSTKAALNDEPHQQGEHDNWWCPQAASYLGLVVPGMKTDPPAVAPTFTSTAPVRKRVEEEQKMLATIGSGATYLLHGVVAWSDAHPDDPRIPEAMAKAIKTTRWACPDARTRSAAYSAFRKLHARYPKSAAAQGSQYWYDGSF